MVTKGSSILGVLYGANAIDLLNAQDSIYARWLQKKIVITNSSSNYVLQGSYGFDRQRFELPASSSLQGTISVYAEDGITPLAKGSLNITTGSAYRLILNNK
jgi:hypothetical protein